MMRTLAITVGCLLCCTAAAAQTYRFRTYTSSSGLPSNIIYCLFQDSKGYMWFGTDSGLSRYDGVQYVNFGKEHGLPDPSVRNIMEDAVGNLWISTKGGVAKYDGKSFQRFGVDDGLPSNEVLSGLVTRKGDIWFGTAKGISRYRSNGFENFGQESGIPPGPVWTMLEASSGVILLGIRGGGFVVYNGNTFRAYHVPDGLPDENVFGLAEDRDGTVWIATAGGFCRFDGSKFHRITKEQGLSSERGGKVMVDRHGRIWFATFGGGISLMENGKFKVFDKRHGLPDNYLTAIIEDSDGYVWVGTRWNGAFRFTDEHFSNYTKENGLSEGMISGIAAAADGTIWVSSINDGLSAIRPDGSIQKFTEQNGLTENWLWSVYVDSRLRVWIGGHKGVSVYEEGDFRHFSLKDIGARDRISAICEDNHGNIWFGSNSTTSNGIIRYDGKDFKTYTTDDGLVSNQIESFGKSADGRLWICTPRGLSIFDGKTFTNYTSEQGLPDRRVLCFYEDELGRKWLGTSSGLALFEGNLFKLFSTEQGLANNSVRSIISQGGKLWIGTSNGISYYDGRSFRTYTTRDGLISNTISTGATAISPDGSIWFGTAEGVVRYSPSGREIKLNPPRLYITGIRSKAKIFTKEQVSVDYDDNTLTIEFVGISPADEDLLCYSSFIEGMDTSWSRPSRERSIRLTLQPGRYTVLIKAISRKGLESQIKTISIDVAAPFWQRTWFYLLIAAILVVLGFATYRWRIRLLIRKQEEQLENERRIQQQKIDSLRQMLESIRVINSQLDLDAVLQKIVEESASLVGGDPGGVGLIEGDELVFKYVWNNGKWEKEKLIFPKGQGIAGTVAATGESIIVNDVKADKRVSRPDLLEKYGVYGIMDVPIRDRQGNVIGVMDIRRRKDQAYYTEIDRQLLEALTHQAAVAIENAGLYSSLAEKSLLLEESLKELEKLYKNEQAVSRALQELNQMKNNFMAITSHEMRTPLAILKGYHEMLADGMLGQLNPKQKQSIDICNRAIERMTTAFTNILEMIKCDEKALKLEVTTLDLKELIESVIREHEIFIKHRRQYISYLLPDGLPKIQADEEKLRQAVTNILQNAIKFTPDGGKIEVSVAIETDNLHVVIKDEGVGIRKEELERIFDKFYTGSDWLHHSSGKYEFQARGSGLGLSIVKSYVEEHGGRVWAESEGLNKGSSFHLLLPITPSLKEQSATVISIGQSK
ncbi:MAG: two-component regulator propeller domain-containing protein [Acidobacteriota bacterium]|nr:ATP-binding protein [Blastocatellia bacterium]MDW8411785.1 two-component regulator propeller domain-containing protein [Acidobacteriota bacterium]